VTNDLGDGNGRHTSNQPDERWNSLGDRSSFARADEAPVAYSSLFVFFNVRRVQGVRVIEIGFKGSESLILLKVESAGLTLRFHHRISTTLTP
jgi:hypothetical protein